MPLGVNLGGNELLPGFLVLSPDCGVAARAEQSIVQSTVSSPTSPVTRSQASQLYNSYLVMYLDICHVDESLPMVLII